MCETIYGELIQLSLKKVLGLINNFSKFSGYKINMQKSVAFLCISNKQIETGTKNRTVSFATASKV